MNTMTNPTITYPNYKPETRLTESLAAPVIESTHRQYEHPMADKVRCGQKHFETLGVPFAVVVSADEV